MGPSSATRSQTSQSQAVEESVEASGIFDPRYCEPEVKSGDLQMDMLYYDGEGMQYVPVTSDGTAFLRPSGDSMKRGASTNFILDTGASATTLTRSVVKDLEEMTGTSLVEIAQDPLELRVANGEMTRLDEITVPLNITLNTRHG